MTSENSPSPDGASIVVIVGNPQANSRTKTVAEAVAAKVGALTSAPDDIAVIDLAEIGPALLGWGDPSVKAAKAAALGAQLLVIATPTYKASYTGLLKLFLDQIGQDELAGVATIAVMTGGSADHSLAVESQLRPVLVELGALVPTRGVYIYGAQIDEPTEAIDAWYAAVEPSLQRISWS